MMNKIDTVLLASKFRGVLLGVLVGDCCGSPFEFVGVNNDQTGVIKKNLDKLEGEYFKAPVKKYSDDTAMTKVFAMTLGNDYSQKELAKNFSREYFQEPNRGYGAAVPTIFNKLKTTKFSDVTLPAREQFFGTGSYGNGGAMRVSPAALYCWNDIDQLRNLVQEATEITHTNKLGINGALLQAYAIHQALSLDPTKQELDIKQFYDSLMTKMQHVEDQEEDDIEKDEYKKLYQTQLKEVERLLLKEEDPSLDEVVDTLGHSVSALYSVPTALYCFLRSQKPSIMSESTNHAFRNTLEFSIRLGGDTDTIASMSCAIAGAYYGDEVISENLLKHLEGRELMQDLANKLYEKVVK